MARLTFKEKMTLGTFATAVIIITLLVATMTTALLLNGNNKVMTTAIRLEQINWEVSNYNNSARKTDAMTQKISKVIEERKELYNSEDWIIATYSNTPGLLKLVIMLTSILIYLLIPAGWIALLYQPIRIVKKYNRRRKKLRN